MDDEMWFCHICTHWNEGLSRTCAMCDQSRTFLQRTSSPLSGQWNFDAADSIDESAEPTGAIRFSICTILRLISGLLTCMLAIVGFFLGAIIGAIAGQTSAGCSLFRGAALGAVAGAVSTIEFMEAFLACWKSEQTTSHPSMVEVVERVLRGTIIERHMQPGISTDHHHWQVNTDNMTYEELYEMFGPGDSPKGASEVLVKNLPWHIIPDDRALDTLGERMSCPICLKDLEHGETARCLPNCQHTFHMDCVDKWLILHGSCPVCRRII